MFSIDNDMTISITRGDVASIPISAVGEAFKLGDIIRIKVFEKNNCANVIFQKDFGVSEETENYELVLTRYETKIGETISKPTTYWYEIELNPDTSPNTIVGYDEDGPKLFVLYPEGEDIEYIPPPEEEIGPIDYELSLTSKKPIANLVVAKLALEQDNKIDESAERIEKLLENGLSTEKAERQTEIAFERNRITNLAKLKEGSTTGDAELTDIRFGADGTVYESAGVSVRGQIERVRSDISDSLGSRYYLKDITSLLTRDICYYTDTGEIMGDASSERTELFSVDFGEEYRISGSYGYGSCLICEFDENKNFVRAVGTSDGSYEIAEDYVYSPSFGVSYIAVSSRRPIGEEPYPLTVKKYVWGFDTVKNFINASIDQKYNPESQNAQSGIAVEEVTRKVRDNVANAIKGAKRGKTIKIDDVSPITHNVPLKLSSKNLINPNATLETIGSYLGINLSKDKHPYNLSIALKDGATIPSDVYFGFVYYVKDNSLAAAIWLIENGTIQRNSANTSGLTSLVGSIEKLGVFVYPATQENWNAVFNAFNVQLEYGSDTTDYEEYIDLTNVTVNVYGKNLFDLKNSQGFYSIYGGITNEIVEDSIIVTCTVSNRGGYLELGTFPAGTYYVSANKSGISIKTGDTAGVSKGVTPAKVTLTETAKLWLYRGFSSTNSSETFSNIQVELAEEQTDYETPNISTYTPNADGTIDDVVSVSPNMTIITDTDGVTIDCEYNKDTNKVIENIVNAVISLGGNV